MNDPLCPLAQERDIFTLSPTLEKELRNKIHESEGQIQIFVHPFYHYKFGAGVNWTSEERDKINRGKNEIYQKARNVSSDSVPTIIFEEDMMLRGGRYNKPVEHSPHAYIVRTFIEKSTPKFDHEWEPRHIDYYDRRAYETYRPSKETESQNWLKVKERLSDLGINEVAVCGMYFKILLDEDIRRPENPMASFWEQRRKSGARNLNYWFEGCAGLAARELATHFTVKILNLLIPDTIQDLLNAESGTRNLDPYLERRRNVPIHLEHP